MRRPRVLCTVLLLVIATAGSLPMLTGAPPGAVVGVAPQPLPALATSDLEPQRGLAADAASSRVAAKCDELDLHCVDLEAGTPVADCRVELRARAGSGAATSGNTDALGSLRLTGIPAGDYVIRTECSSHAVLHGTISIDGHPVRLALDPAGRAAANLVTAAPGPDAPVTMRLLPPLVRGTAWCVEDPAGTDFELPERPPRLQRLGDAWCASDEVIDIWPGHAIAARHLPLLQNGHRKVRGGQSAIWSGLPAAAGYRLAIGLDTVAAIEPAHEDQRLRPGADGVVVGNAPPTQLSGPIAIRTDGAPLIEVRRLAAARVSGSFEGAGTAGCTVHLTRIRFAGEGTASSVTALDPEATTTADAAGHFCFESVRPGLFLVRTSWWSSTRDLHLGSCSFRLEPAADLDLGSIRSSAGTSLPVRVVLSGPRGQALLASEVFRTVGQSGIHVFLGTQPDSRLVSETLFTSFVVEPGHTVLVHGLPPGNVMLQAKIAEPSGLLADAELIDTPISVHATDRCTAVDLRLDVVRLVGQLLRVSWPDGRPCTELLLRCRECSNGCIRSIAYEPSRGGHEARLPEGRHDFLGCVVTNGPEGRSFWVAGSLDVSSASAGETSLEVQPAVTLHGRLLAADAKPVAERGVQWTLPGWDGARADWVFSAITDADGRFRLQGLPPAMQLPGNGVPALSTGSPGLQHATVQLP